MYTTREGPFLNAEEEMLKGRRERERERDKRIDQTDDDNEDRGLCARGCHIAR